jgi:GT2 family glycosyltransferase
MIMKGNIKISIIIVTYNSINDIDNCLKSISKQTLQPFEIIVVDNKSEDDSVNHIKNKYSFIRLIISKTNEGYGRANNLGVKNANGEFIVILNPDTIVTETWLEELVKPLLSCKKIITTSKILTYDGSRINTCGNIIHFTGLGFTRGYGMNPSSFKDLEHVNEASGCSFAIRKEDFIYIGGFDNQIFMYFDDVDFSIRAHLKNFKILYVPNSIVKHDYILTITPKKLYFLEKGRYMILKKYYSPKIIFLISPSLFIAELLSFGYAIKLGKEGLIYKLKSIKEGFQIDLTMMEGDGKINIDVKKLFQTTSVCIPAENISKNKFELFINQIANKIFTLNYLIIKL